MPKTQAQDSEEAAIGHRWKTELLHAMRASVSALSDAEVSALVADAYAATLLRVIRTEDALLRVQAFPDTPVSEEAPPATNHEERVERMEASLNSLHKRVHALEAIREVGQFFTPAEWWRDVRAARKSG